MLLSTAALEKHKSNFDMFKQQMKLNRVKSYVADQQRYIDQYKSPNSSDIDSVPESCENQEPLSSNAFLASISEIIRRKQAHTEAAPSSSIQSPSSYSRKQPLLHPSSIDRYMQEPKRPAAAAAAALDESVQDSSSLGRHNKRHKSSPSSHASERIPLQTKPSMIKKATHGMHLLQKFVSPNLEISRITMKSSTRQPKLGIFRKGKSSAQGRPIPDITDFHDESMASSIKRRESIKPNIVMEDLSHEPPSISKFFSKRPAAQAIHTTTSGGSALSHLHQHATTIHQQDRPTRETPHSTATPVLSSNNQARKGSHSPAAAAADVPYYEALSNNSFDSIYRLLDECHDMNQYQTPTSGHRHAKPSYSPVKTPHSFFQPTTTEEQQHAKINTSNMSFLNNSKLPHPLYLHRSATPRVEPTTTTTTMFASPPPCHYNDALYGAPTHQQPTTMMRKPTLLPALTDQRFSAPSWQVAESVASVAANTAAEEHAQLLQQEKAEEEDDDHTTTANNDLELVLQSQAMNMLDDSIRQNDDDIRGFWLRQPGFTTRDQYNKTC